MKFTKRQEEIINIVKVEQPITSEAIAEKLGVTRAALRADLAILTMTDTLDARPKVGYVYLVKKVNGEILDNLSKIKVGDIMSIPVTVNEDTTVYDAIVHLFLHDVGTLFVESNGNLVGAVSRKDFLKIAIGGTDIHKVPVGVIMTRMPNIIYGYVEDSAYALAKKIIEHEIDSIPIVEKSVQSDNTKVSLKILGKISKTNITKLFVNLGEVN